MNIQTLFKVEKQSFLIKVAGHGQDAATKVLDKYKGLKVVIVGFLINDQTIPVNLGSF